MAEEHKRTSLGHGCSQHYTDVSAKGVEKRAESWFVINTVSTNSHIFNSYYWYVVMQSFPGKITSDKCVPNRKEESVGKENYVGNTCNE